MTVSQNKNMMLPKSQLEATGLTPYGSLGLKTQYLCAARYNIRYINENDSVKSLESVLFCIMLLILDPICCWTLLVVQVRFCARSNQICGWIFLFSAGCCFSHTFTKNPAVVIKDKIDAIIFIYTIQACALIFNN